MNLKAYANQIKKQLENAGVSSPAFEVALLFEKVFSLSRTQLLSPEREIDENLELPIEKGEKVGSMVVLEGDEETARYRLVSDRKVERADFATTYIRMIKKMI